MDHLDIKRLFIYGLAAAVSIFYFRYRQKKGQGTIPALVGSKGPVSRFLAVVQFLRHPIDVVTKGYRQDRSGVFRMPVLFDWYYVASGRKRVLEIASAPEHILSFNQAFEDSSQSKYTIGAEITDNPYHAVAVRGSMTRNLGRCFPQVRDEIVHAFDDVLALEDKKWKLVQVQPAIMQVVARTSNRLFVGLPLCRDPEYLELNINFAVAVIFRGLLIGLLPDFLKPILGPVLSTRKSSLRRALKFLGPMLDQRLQKEEQYGSDWPDKPAPGEERTTPALATRILTVNFAAIHTSSMALTDALYDLAAHPAHIGPMREEAERVVAQEGWTKTAVGNMHKIDSFLRESHRLHGIGQFAMMRKVVAKDGFTFSDGTMIPHGAILTVPACAMHHDEDIYAQADVFDGFRFSRMREARAGHDRDEGEDPGLFNLHMVSTGPYHLVFGHGRHACPGRFFAAMELKAMLAHMLINYDIKAETEGVQPPDIIFGAFRSPSADGKIWIRKREGM
ncbi:cytochrome P450 [Mycena sp. CBHHK59/15]|nr:cytochrome P450 [Mycena sp. CBHHK59/15]